MAPFVKAGRAAFGVVLQGYVGTARGGERIGQRAAAQDGTSAEYAELTVNRMIDLRRGVDYLDDASRSRSPGASPSLDGAPARSWGMILAAIETRYRAVVIMGAGLPIEYAPYVAHVNPDQLRVAHPRAQADRPGALRRRHAAQDRGGAAVQAAARTEATGHLRGRARRRRST